MSSLKVGIVGVGNISKNYLKHIALLPNAEVVAVADLDLERAKSVAEEFTVPHALSVNELLEHKDVDLVLNLTIPAAHYNVSLRALQAGKHVHTEKPLSLERSEGEELVRIAKENGLIIGCAPDTVLGASIQTCRNLIDSGAIGKPIGFNAFMLSHGPENWHPAPSFFYQRGGGPLFDMGPYYLSALVTLLGPINRVTSFTQKSFAEREIIRGDLTGTKLPVEVQTHIVSAIQTQGGAIGQLTISFDVWGTKLPNIEIYGTEGTLSVPDPNNFEGTVLLYKDGMKEWEEMPMTFNPIVNGRGLGIYDIAEATSHSRSPIASGAVGLHVLDTMHSILESGELGHAVEIKNQVARPEAMAKYYH